MPSCLISNPVETAIALTSIVADFPTSTGAESSASIGAESPASLSAEHAQTLCFDGVCSVDSGFAALLRNSKGKLTVASTEEARGFDFANSPKLS